MSFAKIPLAGALAVIVMALSAAPTLAASGTWVAHSTPPDVLLGPTVAGLPDGRILIAGGESSAHTGMTSEAEVYDTAADKWTIVHPMPAPRLFGAAVVLKDGSVMIFGGSVSNGPDAAVTYDPRTETWSSAGPMPVAIGVGASAIELADGRVLVAGGEDPNRVPLAAAEIFDPSRRTWSATGHMASARESSAATLLTSGKALVIGGLGLSGPLSSAELYDPSSGKWSSAGELAEARYAAAAVRLSDGRVLAAGVRRGDSSTARSSTIPRRIPGNRTVPCNTAESARRWRSAVATTSWSPLILKPRTGLFMSRYSTSSEAIGWRGQTCC